jgi:hypothetical protein
VLSLQGYKMESRAVRTELQQWSQRVEHGREENLGENELSVVRGEGVDYFAIVSCYIMTNIISIYYFWRRSSVNAEGRGDVVIFFW